MHTIDYINSNPYSNIKYKVVITCWYAILSICSYMVKFRNLEHRKHLHK